MAAGAGRVERAWLRLRERRRGAGGLPARRQQRGHVEEADAAREARHHVGQVRDRVDLGELAAAEQRVGDGGALAAGVASSKEEVLAVMQSTS
jgi:hypothetical protein